jgi:hypothetical protein
MEPKMKSLTVGFLIFLGTFVQATENQVVTLKCAFEKQASRKKIFSEFSSLEPLSFKIDVQKNALTVGCDDPEAKDKDFCGIMRMDLLTADGKFVAHKCDKGAQEGETETRAIRITVPEEDEFTHSLEFYYDVDCVTGKFDGDSVSIVLSTTQDTQPENVSQIVCKALK